MLPCISRRLAFEMAAIFEDVTRAEGAIFGIFEHLRMTAADRSGRFAAIALTGISTPAVSIDRLAFASTCVTRPIPPPRSWPHPAEPARFEA